MSERYGAGRREVPGTRRDFSGIALAGQQVRAHVEQSVSFGDYRFEVETGRLWSAPQEVQVIPKLDMT